MAHKRIKFKDKKVEGIEVKGWHLLATIGDGEYTACGIATPEYETEEEIKEKGGITCPECIETIRYYKQIKL